MSRGGKRIGAGRPKGSKNKTPNEIRSLLSQALSGELEKIPEYLDSIEDAEKKLNLLAKFLPYIAPRMSELKGEIKESEPEKESLSDYSKLSLEELKTLLELEEKAAADGKPDDTAPSKEKLRTLIAIEKVTRG